MKIKSGYTLKKVMGSYMIVALAGDVSHMQTTNETGAFLWELLQNDKTTDELVAALISEYETDAETAKRDIESFTAKLREASLLDE
ncbi:MAG: PqqD family protein [Clostridia bacterium]|nr:PqqD family protein [Clostridia bacterium]